MSITYLGKIDCRLSRVKVQGVGLRTWLKFEVIVQGMRHGFKTVGFHTLRGPNKDASKLWPLI